ncbi:MAG: hypothetical protein GY847_00685 [Proteobacteria bacterium]|nr:hypothetical protein [Pseudomonadota bacterium]
MNEELNRKVVVVADLSRYSDIAEEMEQQIPGATRQLDNQIKEIIHQALNDAGISPGTHPHDIAGDSAIVVFDASIMASTFGETLHRTANLYNKSKSVMAQRHFRIGICTGDISIRATKGTNGSIAKWEFSGKVISNAKRLETACRTGEILIDKRTWMELPPKHRRRYRSEELVHGKRQEQFCAHRRKVVSSAPWESLGVKEEAHTLHSEQPGLNAKLAVICGILMIPVLSLAISLQIYHDRGVSVQAVWPLMLLFVLVLSGGFFNMARSYRPEERLGWPKEILALFIDKLPIEHAGILRTPHVCILQEVESAKLRKTIERHFIGLLGRGAGTDREKGHYVKILDIGDPEISDKLPRSLAGSRALILVRCPSKTSDRKMATWAVVAGQINKWSRRRSAIPAVALLVGGVDIPPDLEWMAVEKASYDSLEDTMHAIAPGLLDRAATRAILWRGRAGLLHASFVVLLICSTILGYLWGVSSSKLDEIRNGLNYDNMGQALKAIDGLKSGGAGLYINNENINELSGAIRTKLQQIEGPSVITDRCGLSLWGVFSHEVERIPAGDKNPKFDVPNESLGQQRTVIGEIIKMPLKSIPPGCFLHIEPSAGSVRQHGEPRKMSAVGCAAFKSWIVTVRRDGRDHKLRAYELNGEKVAKDEVSAHCEYRILDKPDDQGEFKRDEFGWRSFACLPLVVLRIDNESNKKLVKAKYSFCMTFKNEKAVGDLFVLQALSELGAWLNGIRVTEEIATKLKIECSKAIITEITEN